MSSQGFVNRWQKQRAKQRRKLIFLKFQVEIFFFTLFLFFYVSFSHYFIHSRECYCFIWLDESFFVYILLYGFYFVFLSSCCDCAKESMFYILFYDTFTRISLALFFASFFFYDARKFFRSSFHFTFFFLSFLLCSLIHVNLDFFSFLDKNRIELNSNLLIFFFFAFKYFHLPFQFMKIHFLWI